MLSGLTTQLPDPTCCRSRKYLQDLHSWTLLEPHMWYWSLSVHIIRNKHVYVWLANPAVDPLTLLLSSLPKALKESIKWSVTPSNFDRISCNYIDISLLSNNISVNAEITFRKETHSRQINDLLAATLAPNIAIWSQINRTLNSGNHPINPAMCDYNLQVAKLWVI